MFKVFQKCDDVQLDITNVTSHKFKLQITSNNLAIITSYTELILAWLWLHFRDLMSGGNISCIINSRIRNMKLCNRLRGKFYSLDLQFKSNISDNQFSKVIWNSTVFQSLDLDLGLPFSDKKFHLNSISNFRQSFSARNAPCWV